MISAWLILFASIGSACISLNPDATSNGWAQLAGCRVVAGIGKT